MLRIFLPSVATALEPPEQWIEYMHLKALYTTSLQLSHNTAFSTKGWEWSEYNENLPRHQPPRQMISSLLVSLVFLWKTMNKLMNYPEAY